MQLNWLIISECVYLSVLSLLIRIQEVVLEGHAYLEPARKAAHGSHSKNYAPTAPFSQLPTRAATMVKQVASPIPVRAVQMADRNPKKQIKQSEEPHESDSDKHEDPSKLVNRMLVCGLAIVLLWSTSLSISGNAGLMFHARRDHPKMW